METRKKSKARWALHLLWIVPLLIVLAFAAVMYVIPAFETVDKTAPDGAADWMANLDDAMPLSEVVLPGTHDSATKNVQLAYFSKCQALTVGEQLDAGFRYLDIRLGASGKQLKLMHGFTNCTTLGFPWAATLTFDDVLADTYAFLKAHPTETVVFAVKHEHGSETPEQFEALLSAYIEQNPDAWLLTDAIPKVAEARGKIVLLRHYENAEEPVPSLGIPCFWDTQKGHGDVTLNAASHENDSYTLTVQDRYEFDTDDKWNAFRKGQDAARTGEDALSISFLSTKGTASFGHPYAFAKALNPKLSELQTPLKGWVVIDFGSAALAEKIYQTNFNGK